MTEEKGSYQKLRAEGQYSIGAEAIDVTFNEIGKRGQRRVDGYEKATGKALYTRDLQMPGMLYARVLRSPYARARIPAAPRRCRVSGPSSDSMTRKSKAGN
jgi:hypothetical protein